MLPVRISCEISSYHSFENGFLNIGLQFLKTLVFKISYFYQP